MIDLLVRGALVFDGTGGAPAHADVAVHDGLIAAVAPGSTSQPRTRSMPTAWR